MRVTFNDELQIHRCQLFPEGIGPELFIQIFGLADKGNVFEPASQLENVIGFNPIAVESGPPEIRAQTLIEQIDSLAHIASEFSNFAKMPRATQVDLDLVPILRQSANLFAESEQVIITLNIRVSGPAVVHADQEQMKRVFTNLIKNAVQARTENRPGRVAIELIQNGANYQVSVADNGRGIAPEDYERIFVPNFTTKSTGMGLGLAMVKNIVTSSGGHITFTSTQGEGATFTLELPVHQPKT